MSDKLKSPANTKISFAGGESVIPAKLTAISAQMLAISNTLEKAIGDVFGGNWPYSSLNTNSLSTKYGIGLADAANRFPDITSIARLIGPSSSLNPHMISAESEIIEALPEDVNEYMLKYKPVSGATFVFTGTSACTTKVDAEDVDGAGDYSVDELGRLTSFSVLDGGTITYSTDPRDYFGGNNYDTASFNTIPDLNQVENGNGVTVNTADSFGRYQLDLPVVTHHHYNSAFDSIQMDAADQSYNQQLKLPSELTDYYSSGDEIPSGFIVLKNATKNIVYSEATYLYISDDSLYIKNVELDEDIADGDTFYLITVGTNITTSIDDLRRKSYHSHRREFGEPLVSIYDLADIFKLPGSSGKYVKSSMDNNPLPQYLNRDGYNASESTINDRNCMRGDLLLGAASGHAGTYTSTVGRSFKVVFGSASGPYIRRSAGGALELYADEHLLLQSISDLGEVRGGLNLTSTDKVVTNAGIAEDVSLLIGTGAGNLECMQTGVFDSVVIGNVIGPSNEIFVYDENGEDAGISDGTYATTASTGAVVDIWKPPATRTAYMAQKNVKFNAKDTAGADASAWSAVSYLQQHFELPCNGEEVLSCTVLVKARNTDRWHNLGQSPAGSIYTGHLGGCYGTFYINDQYASTTPNEVHIQIGALGAENDFYALTLMGLAGEGTTDDPNNDNDDCMVDVKIYIVYAALNTTVV